MEFLMASIDSSSDESISDSILSEAILENVQIVDVSKIKQSSTQPKIPRTSNREIKEKEIKKSPISEFTKEIERKIIDYFSQNPCLWETPKKNVYNKALKQSVLGVLAHQLDNKFTGKC